ncbi:PREDICTED: uncharacterized protein LOC108684863 [Atta colombica]|uniref:uncharacterized protein LOC108684863 n=1 Tax=Atta colombica TaxID=520822 RepID=UPI00084CDDEA|nr:PREDICTED: uncharacterized protein LOC108684863 [Atta colombica]
MLYFQVCFVAALSASADKQKRNILLGNPYYGTEHDHHHKYENEVKPQQIYEPPSYIPGKSLRADFFAISDADKTSSSCYPSPTEYRISFSMQILINFIKSVDDKNSAAIKKTNPRAASDCSQACGNCFGNRLPSASEGRSLLSIFSPITSYSSYDNILLRIVGYHLQVQVVICIKYR